MINLNHDNYLLQDELWPWEESKDCLFAIEILSVKAVYSEEGKDRIF